jgi:hypothetical protein
MTTTVTARANQDMIDAAWTDWRNARDELHAAEAAEAEPCHPSERRRRRAVVDEKRDIEEMHADYLRISCE